ncbi:MAG: hypothetical protein WCB27_24545 [Thermoguttaceae bacterium]|jgi:hypothetical protein
MDQIAKKMPDVYVLEEDSTDEPTVTGTKSIAKQRRDDRRSNRCNVPPARQSCELKVGANVRSASLVNESKDGFAVLTDRLDGLKVGKKVELHTDIGRFTVRVVYIQNVVPPRNAAPECESWFRVGMKIKQQLQQQRQ